MWDNCCCNKPTICLTILELSCLSSWPSPHSKCVLQTNSGCVPFSNTHVKTLTHSVFGLDHSYKPFFQKIPHNSWLYLSCVALLSPKNTGVCLRGRWYRSMNPVNNRSAVMSSVSSWRSRTSGFSRWMTLSMTGSLSSQSHPPSFRSPPFHRVFQVMTSVGVTGVTGKFQDMIRTYVRREVNEATTRTAFL
jgi:hypothetical protein